MPCVFSHDKKNKIQIEKIYIYTYTNWALQAARTRHVNFTGPRGFHCPGPKSQLHLRDPGGQSQRPEASHVPLCTAAGHVPGLLSMSPACLFTCTHMHSCIDSPFLTQDPGGSSSRSAMGHWHLQARSLPCRRPLGCGAFWERASRFALRLRGSLPCLTGTTAPPAGHRGRLL